MSRQSSSLTHKGSGPIVRSGSNDPDLAIRVERMDRVRLTSCRNESHWE